MNWLIFILVGVMFLIAPYRRGLFFDSDFYLIECIILSAFLIWTIRSFFVKKERIPPSYYIVLTVPILFACLFTIAETPKGNFDNFLRWLAYACFFLLFVAIQYQKKIREMLPYFLQLTGIGIGVFSLFGFWGWIDYRDVMLEDRFTGPFQYANTFAAITGSYWIFSLVLVSRRQQSVYSVLAYSFPLIIYGVAFLHSYSKGGLLVLPIAWFIGLVLLRFREQLNYIFYTLLSFGGSLVAFSELTSQQSSGGPHAGLIPIVIGTIAVCGLSLLRFSKKINTSFFQWADKYAFQRYGHWTISIGIVIVGIFVLMDLMNRGLIYQALPISIQARVSDINLNSWSVLGRTAMFEDALQISKYSPFYGFGGEGWRVVYHLYQTRPYYSNEVHNGYLEVLLNTGWVGLFIFATIFVYLLIEVVSGLRRQGNDSSRLVTVASISALAMLLIHSGIDFNFSFGYVWLLVFAFLAMSVSHDNGIKFNLPSVFLNPNYSKWIGLSGKSLIVLFVLVGVVYTFRFSVADRHMAKAQNGVSSLEEWIDHVDNSFSSNPYNTDIGISLANAYVQYYQAIGKEETREIINSLLSRIESLEPNNSKVAFAIGNIRAQLGEFDNAIAYLERAIKLERFNIEYYQVLIDMKYQIAQIYAGQGNINDSQKLAQEILIAYSSYLQWYRTFINQDIPDRRQLEMNNSTLVTVAKSHLLLGDPQTALEVIKPLNPRIIPDVDENKSDKVDIVSLGEVLQRFKSQVIVLAVTDDAVTNLSQDTKRLLTGLGSKIGELGTGGSYVGVVRENQVVFERIGNESEVLADHETAPELMGLFGSMEYELYSAGTNFGSRSSILINGIEYSQNIRGINLSVFDQTMTPIANYSFDTHQSEILIYPVE